MMQKSLDFDAIKDSIDPISILQYYGFKHIRNYGDTIRACCGIHNGDNETGFVWNLNNNLWYCYTGDCGGGDIYDLVMMMEGIDFKSAVYKLAEIADLNIDGITFQRNFNAISEQRKWLEKEKQKHILSLEKEYVNLIPHKKYRVDEIEENILTHRFKPETFDFYNSYFARIFPTEDKLYENKLVIPIIKSGICHGVALRDYTGLAKSKWLYQPKGIKMNAILYNFDEAKQIIEDNNLNDIVLTEGIFDVWAYHEAGIDNVVCVFGSNLSNEQEKLILRAGVNVVLSFDNDDAGNKCKAKAIKMLKDKTEVKQIYLPDGKDPCDLDRETLHKLYLNRT